MEGGSIGGGVQEGGGNAGSIAKCNNVIPKLQTHL